jgi:hypothetical protein
MLIFSLMLLTAARGHGGAKAAAAPATEIKVDGGVNVTVAKKPGYITKCDAVLKVTTQGPAQLHLEVRAHDGSKGVGLQLVREDKFTSDNMLAPAKSKGKEKEKAFPLTSDLFVNVPNGPQHYALRCSEATEVAVFFEVNKKPSKKNLASAEKEMTAAQQKEVAAAANPEAAKAAEAAEKLAAASSEGPPLAYLMPWHVPVFSILSAIGL